MVREENRGETWQSRVVIIVIVDVGRRPRAEEGDGLAAAKGDRDLCGKKRAQLPLARSDGRLEGEEEGEDNIIRSGFDSIAEIAETAEAVETV